MRDTMGIIMTGGQDVRLSELTKVRSVAALPFAGRYRLIDFMLSNMVNSGIINVGITTEANYSSLMDHVGSGKPWDLNRKVYGLFMLPPNVSHDSLSRIQGDMDVLHGTLPFIRHSTQTYALVTNGQVICNMTFQSALEFHEASGADVTLIYHELSDEDELLDGVVLEMDESGRVTGMEKAPRYRKSNHVSMGMMLLKRTKLEEILEEGFAKGSHDLVRDVFAHQLNDLKIYGYRFDGYVGQVNTVHTYYQNNMNVLKDEVRKELFFGKNRIFTKVKDQVPTRYGEASEVKESLLADGCEIDGVVENSIIFRGVKVKKGAVVRNSIVMQNTVIEEGARIEQVVVDKECQIGAHKTLMGSESYPIIVGKRNIV